MLEADRNHHIKCAYLIVLKTIMPIIFWRALPGFAFRVQLKTWWNFEWHILSGGKFKVDCRRGKCINSDEKRKRESECQILQPWKFWQQQYLEFWNLKLFWVANIATRKFWQNTWFLKLRIWKNYCECQISQPGKFLQQQYLEFWNLKLFWVANIATRNFLKLFKTYGIETAENRDDEMVKKWSSRPQVVVLGNCANPRKGFHKAT